MILARITKAIREQNWFAVALEFVIVIAGVVIGFQVTEWRGERADRESEQIYLERLYSDMEQSVCQIRHEQRGVTNWNRRARRTLDAILTNDPDAVNDSGFELIAATRIQTGSPFRATLNELVNGGQMNLISNEMLRARISEADARMTSRGENIDILVNAQSTFMGAVQSRLRPTPGNVYDITYDFDALVEDDIFINSLGHALRITYANASWLGDMADIAEELRVAVGEEIGLDMSSGPDCAALEGNG